MPVDVHNPPGSDYTLVVRLVLYVEGFGMAQWTISGVMAQNALFTTLLAYRKATEAMAGKIPVLRFDPPEQVPVRSRNGELHPAPRIVIVGWVVRDPAQWGAPTVPVPRAQVEDETGGSGGAPLSPPLPTPVEPDPAKPLPPANDAAPMPAAVPANDDAFAGMTPAVGAPPF